MFEWEVGGSSLVGVDVQFNFFLSSTFGPWFESKLHRKGRRVLLLPFLFVWCPQIHAASGVANFLSRSKGLPLQSAQVFEHAGQRVGHSGAHKYLSKVKADRTKSDRKVTTIKTSLSKVLKGGVKGVVKGVLLNAV